MHESGDSGAKATISRRSLINYVADKVAVPAVVALLVSGGTAVISRRFAMHHQISVAIIRSDSAAPVEQEVSDFDFFLGITPTPLPSPGPNVLYTYTILTRNNGDFPEEDITTSMSFQTDSQKITLVSEPQVDASSNLVARTVARIDPVESAPGYSLAVPRLNPREWLSLKFTWRQRMDVKVDVRSNETTASSSI